MPLLLWLALAACQDKSTDASAEDSGDSPEPDDSGDTDTDTDTDSDSDSAPDSDTDTDSGASDTLCADLGLSVQPWQDATDDDTLGALAADLTLSTTEGDWNLAEHWTGCEVYLFIPSQPNQASGWPDDLWSSDRDTANIFDDLPRNAQLFFIGSERSDETRAESMAMIEDGINSALEDMDEADAEYWRPRVHFVDGRDTEQPGWLGDTLSNPGWGAGIDRFQRIRYIGSFADPRRYNSSYGWFEPNISYVSWEAVGYNYQAKIQDQMDADGADVVHVFDGDTCSGSVTTDITLPDAEVMAGYDTLSVDLTMACVGDGEYGDCPAWDYMAYLWACDVPVEEENPYSDTACQPYVAETLGACASTGASCRADSDCTSADGSIDTCSGYVAAISADTQTGQCRLVDGTETSASYTCNSEGTGYDDLACGCSTEIGRWITTYHREGRWLTDISSYLPLFQQGGTQKVRFETQGPYELTMDLRFSTLGKEARPDEITWLFGGGGIYEGSNALYEPVTVYVPADAVKVEIATIITGHGADGNNCGEFCDMAHWFVVNGDADRAVVRDFPEASSSYGCRDQTEDGTVPNQYGTWWYGRAGWCPGKDVPVEVADITDQVTPGADNTFTYYALFDGAEYTGYSTNRMSSWLVVSR